MAINGTDWFNNPWNTTFSPFTDFFEDATGVGNTFYLLPLIVLTFGIYIHTKDAVMASMFMIASGALLSSSSLFAGAVELVPVFVIFTAIGFVGLFIGIVFHK